MSKGTPLVVIRVPEDLKIEVEAVIEHRNWNSREEPWSFSDFVRIALREKIAKMARCRGKSLEGKKVGPPAESRPAGSREASRYTNIPSKAETVHIEDANFRITQPTFFPDL
jgi:hypothetical protein